MLSNDFHDDHSSAGCDLQTRRNFLQGVAIKESVYSSQTRPEPTVSQVGIS
jgi:hypothetical protein